jgi:raffinose/stachyose/melibiose transport system permease protein
MRRLLPYLLLTAFTGLILLPFVLIASTALKSQAELAAGVFALPRSLEWGNFVTAWTEGRFGVYFANSLIVVVPVVAGSLLLCTLSGYAFALLPLPGRGILLALLLLGMVIPLEGLIIPMYYNLRAVGLHNSYWALILPQVALSIPFGTYLMWITFQGLPEEVVDAAVVDGASRSTVLWRILVPMARPTLGALTVFFFIWTWNEFLIPLVLISDDSLRTLPVGLAFFQGRYTANVPVLAAGATVVAAPLIVVYLLFQRQVIRGLVAGAVK